MNKEFSRLKRVNGRISFPGDKSISHRALLFSAMADGESIIHNLSDGEDVRSTKNCIELLGVKVSQQKNFIRVSGVGAKGFKKSSLPLNCGNSGTTARLLSGLLIAQDFESILIGDESLSMRPMKRLIEPLELMGGKMVASSEYTLPIVIQPSLNLREIQYNLIVPSAQVKSAILIAGLHNENESMIIESVPTRDHTERLLELEVIREGNKIISKSSKNKYPVAKEYFIPGDISSASFLIVAALNAKSSELIVENISLNKTRIAFLELLIEMGGRIDFINTKISNNEHFGDLLIKSSDLKNITIDKKIIPSLIDEIPILAVAGVFAEGRFEIRNCKELRVKESDRIKSVCQNLNKAGLSVTEYDDGFSFEGNIKNTSIRFDSYNDHRIAMAFAILAMLNSEGGKVNNFECVNISNPGFLKQLQKVAEFY